MKQILKGLIFFFSFLLVAILFAGLTIFILERREILIDVPDLRGKDIISTRGILEKNRLRIIEESSYHNTIPKDYVINQEPEPGEKIRKGEKIKVVISLGMPDVSIPRVIGKDLYSAKIILSKIGLALGNITYINSEKPKDIVLGFSAEKEGIKEGDRVNLLVSSGKKQGSFLMPDLCGFSLDVASSTIKEYNLVLGDVLLEPGTDAIVLKQSPISGMRVDEGTRVDITLGISEEW
ncbi:MAG: PASTA domain-containing protein [bacterium]